MTFFSLIFFFGVVPVAELFFKPVRHNLSQREQLEIANAKVYDLLLWVILPVQYAFLIFFFYTVQNHTGSLLELTGIVTAMGLMCGVFGINVGHELGHRKSRWQQLVGELLLLSSLDMHFLPYHNAGHHKHVATPDDPATARKGEWVFWFWVRSNFTSWWQAWQLEARRMRKLSKPVLSVSNRMVVYQFAQVGLLIVVFAFFGTKVLLAFLVAAVFGVLLLETVNYIEHYGLVRNKNYEGKYERVRPWHSWNSDHIIGRVILFELSRHSDHHYKASKRYQLLESGKDSPQMPTGYPGMMLLALIPPLWFRVMNPRVDEIKAAHCGG